MSLRATSNAENIADTDLRHFDDPYTRVLRLVCQREEGVRQQALQQMLQLADSVHKSRLVEVTVDMPADVPTRMNSTLPIRG